MEAQVEADANLLDASVPAPKDDVMASNCCNDGVANAADRVFGVGRSDASFFEVPEDVVAFVQCQALSYVFLKTHSTARSVLVPLM